VNPVLIRSNCPKVYLSPSTSVQLNSACDLATPLVAEATEEQRAERTGDDRIGSLGRRSGDRGNMADVTVSGLPIIEDASLGISYNGEFTSGAKQNGFNTKLSVSF